MGNPIAIQFFEWYLPDDGKHWQRLEKELPHLRELGVSGIWIPPAYKGTGKNDVGYGVYDLYDLGEFDQKGTVPTKYGTLEELERAIAAIHDAGMKVYGDTVINHKAGADETELFRVIEVNPENRDEEISEPFDIEGWTHFTFPGRAGKYSDFEWHFYHFTATDFDQKSGKSGIYKIVGDYKQFSDNVSEDKGNFDYLMFADIDYDHPEAREEIKRWVVWFVDKLQLDGLRMDALKHIDDQFIAEFVEHAHANTDRELYIVGEYWNGDDELLGRYLDNVKGSMDLFDVPLHFNFHHASEAGDSYDMRAIFDNSLVRKAPQNVMTFVDNHDSQLGQSLQSWVKDWFKPLAYALILLREDGYPCLFYGDYYGCGGENPVEGMRDQLDPLLKARQIAAYGEQRDAFDDANVIGFQRTGDAEHPDSGLVCVMSNAVGGAKTFSFGADRAGETFVDLTGNVDVEITLDENGSAEFGCADGSVSVWVAKALTE